jgi:hypothetical protein
MSVYDAALLELTATVIPPRHDAAMLEGTADAVLAIRDAALLEGHADTVATARSWSLLVAAAMMQPGTAEGEWLDRWGRALGGIYRRPYESDESYAARLAVAGEAWATAGTTGFIEAWLAEIGWDVSVAVDPLSLYRRLLEIDDTDGRCSSLQLVADVVKFCPAHLLYEVLLGGDLAYEGIDYRELDVDSYSGFDDISDSQAFDAWRRFV